MKYGIANLSIIPIRYAPNEKSEMVSQLLFGECFIIQSEQEAWVEIETCFDNYRGWISKNMCHIITQQYYNKYLSEKHFVEQQIFNILTLNEHTPPTIILAGSTLPFYNSENRTIQLEKKLLKLFREPFIEPIIDIRKNIEVIAVQYINTPYLWGGRSPFGIDCSGLTQVIYKMIGKKIPRDAYQQAQKGILVKSLDEAKSGDLAFFGNENKITHVGILLNNNRIIHSSGKVRIDIIDEKGIINLSLKNYTHQLITIKNIIDANE